MNSNNGTAGAAHNAQGQPGEGTVEPWGFPRPSWVVNVDVDVDPDQTMVTLQGKTHTAGEFEARIEKTYIVHHDEGDSLYESPTCVLVPELHPDQSAATAAQIAEVIGAAGSELRDFEASLVV